MTENNTGSDRKDAGFGLALVGLAIAFALGCVVGIVVQEDLLAPMDIGALNCPACDTPLEIKWEYYRSNSCNRYLAAERLDKKTPRPPWKSYSTIITGETGGQSR